jgi:hypothetical protein
VITLKATTGGRFKTGHTRPEGITKLEKREGEDRGLSRLSPADCKAADQREFGIRAFRIGSFHLLVSTS